MTLVRTSKMATVNICDRTQAGQTKRLRFHSINFAENVVSLKEKICKETDRELNNIGNTQTFTSLNVKTILKSQQALAF